MPQRLLALAAWAVAVAAALSTFVLLQRPESWAPTVHAPWAQTSDLIAAGPPVTSPAAPATVGPAPAAEPLRLRIPSLGVDAGVEAVGVDVQGRMGTPSDAEHVGWYRPGAVPGGPGDAVLDGHLEWYTGPGVFEHLDRLRAGDAIVVVSAAGERTFRVDRLSRYPYDATVPDLFRITGPSALSLITCTGGWDARRRIYLQRLVVEASPAADMANL